MNQKSKGDRFKRTTEFVGNIHKEPYEGSWFQTTDGVVLFDELCPVESSPARDENDGPTGRWRVTVEFEKGFFEKETA